jgi:hypothetical protein
VSNHKDTQNKALAIVKERGFFERIRDEIEEPLSSAFETTEKLTANVIISSAQIIDLGLTTVNACTVGVGSTAKYSSQTLKSMDIDGMIKSITVDLLTDGK